MPGNVGNTGPAQDRPPGVPEGFGFSAVLVRPSRGENHRHPEAGAPTTGRNGTGAASPSPSEKSDPTSAVRRRVSQNQFASDLEDGALLAGGLLAGVATATSAPQYVVLALWIAAAGKTLPSLFRERRDAPLHRNLRALSKADPARFGDKRTWCLDILGDVLLLTFATAAALDAVAIGLHWPSWGNHWYPLAIIGAAFALRATVDIVEDYHIACQPPTGDFQSTKGVGGSRGTESMLFLVFGLTAIVMAWSHPSPSTTETAYALGLGAIGKAVPSLLAPGSGGSSGDGSSGASGNPKGGDAEREGVVLEVWAAPPPGATKAPTAPAGGPS